MSSIKMKGSAYFGIGKGQNGMVLGSARVPQGALRVLVGPKGFVSIIKWASEMLFCMYDKL
jgi:hypothetical protein